MWTFFYHEASEYTEAYTLFLVILTSRGRWKDSNIKPIAKGLLSIESTIFGDKEKGILKAELILGTEQCEVGILSVLHQVIILSNGIILVLIVWPDVFSFVLS